MQSCFSYIVLLLDRKTALLRLPAPVPYISACGYYFAYLRDCSNLDYLPDFLLIIYPIKRPHAGPSGTLVYTDQFVGRSVGDLDTDLISV